MQTTNPVPSQDPSDLLFNAGKLDEVVSGSNATYTDRLGISRRTMAGVDAAADVVLGGLGYAPPVAYAAGISLTLTTQTVEYAGEVYAPKVANLPFTTSGTFETAKFRLIQGVASADLASGGGAAMVGYTPVGTGAVATTVQSKLRETVSVKDFKCSDGQPVQGDGVHDDTTGIQAAIDYLSSIGGGELLFDALRYKITSTINLKSNIKYTGKGSASFYPSSPSTNRGATLVWGGSASGVMVKAINTWHVRFDGISLLGTYTFGSGNTLNGIAVATDSTTQVDANSQRNYFSNFSIQKCETAVQFGVGFPVNSGNVDGWVVDKFIIDACNTGVRVACQNVAYAEILNGLVSVYSTGVSVDAALFLKLTSIAFFGMLGPGSNPGTAMISINEKSGSILIDSCQGEENNAGYALVAFTGAEKLTPTTLINNMVDMKIVVDAKQRNLTFIGNTLNSPVYLNSTGSNVVSINDRIVPGSGFQKVGKNNLSIMNGDGDGTFVPRLYKGATEITSPSYAVGHWVRRGNIVNVKIYFEKDSGTATDAGAYSFKNLPFYSSITGDNDVLLAGNVIINGIDYNLSTPHRWSVGDNSVTATLRGNNSSTNWTSSLLAMQLCGTYFVPDYPTPL